MTLVASITADDVYTKLRALLLDILPAGVEVIRGLDNRTAWPPASPGFVAMTAVLLVPLRTPVEYWDTSDPAPTTINIEQGTKIMMQLDCYGEAASDWAIAIVAVMRNGYSVPFLDPVAPLYADDPKQAALVDSEDQYAKRWIVTASLQYNPIFSPPQEFANELDASLINVDVSFPP